MKQLIILITLLCGLVYVTNAIPQKSGPTAQKPAPATGGAGGQYTSKYDNINLDEILASKRLVGNYVSCLTGAKNCSPEGAELKKLLPDALQTKCAKCTERQKQGALRVIKTVMKDYPQEWQQLSAKWDPTGQYFKEFSKQLA